MFHKIVLISVLYLCFSQGIFAAEQFKYYESKVFDYTPSKADTQRDTLLKNIEKYVEIIEQTPLGSTDMLVFPEYGLVGTYVFDHSDLTDSLVTIPDPSELDLCRADKIEPAISDLACMILQRNIYTVVNMLEKGNNNEKYSTTVVFARNGTIQAKYRKINLQGVESKFLTAGKEKITFTTDFGVTFAVIASYDVLHKSPGSDIFEDRRVTDVVMPTAWYSEVPFFTSLGVQDGYAKKHGINLLASGYSDPSNSLGGTGVYTPTFKSVYIPRVPGTQPKSQQVEIIAQRKPEKACNKKIEPRGIIGGLPTIDSFITQKMTNVDSYIYKSILTGASEYHFEDEFCKGKMCCKFTIHFDRELASLSQDYNAVVSETACGLIACDKKDEISTCGSRHQDLKGSYFDNITIEMKLENKNAYNYIPVSSNIGLEPITYTYCDTSTEITLSAKQQEGVVYFGFITSSANTSSSIVIQLNFGILALVSVLYCFMLK